MTSKTTSALTGLAGSRNTGTPSGPSWPKPCTEPGCIAMRVTSISPSWASTDRTRDDDHLCAVDLALNDFPQFVRLGVDDADAVHLGAGIAARRSQGVRIHVVDLPVAGRSGNVHELAADAHHRQSRPRVHQHTLTTDRPATGRSTT